MKNVLFISPTGTLDNGAEVSIVNFMDYLTKNNYKVFNVAPQNKLPKQIEYYDYCQSKGIITFFIPVLKWWWPDAPGGVPGTDFSRTEAYRENIKEIRKIIRENHIDVVITNTVNIFQGAVASACENVKHLWLIHEFPENEFAYYKEKIKFIEANSDALFAVNGNLRHSLMKLFHEKSILPFVPYSEIDELPLNHGEKSRIVCIGMLSERKNQLELIQAYKLANRQNIELLFVGPNESNYLKKCQDYIKQNHIQGVNFLGYQENPWTVVTDKDICAFPSKNETFGLVYIESVMRGIPTVLSNNEGHLSAYEIAHTGTVYEQGNIKQLAHLLQDTLDNFESAKEEAMSKIPEIRSNFSIENAYKEIINEINIPKNDEINPMFFVRDLLSLNEEKTRLMKLEFLIRNILSKIKRKFFQK